MTLAQPAPSGIDTPTAPQLNPKQIAMLKGLRNGTLLPQLLRTYRDQCEQQIAAIRSAVAAGDAPGIASAAHSLKSASFSIGADEIGKVCATLESRGREGALPETALLCAELSGLHAALLPELDQYLTS